MAMTATHIDSEQEVRVGFKPEARYDYKYPFGLNLRPGTPLHNKIVGHVMDMARASHAEISKRYDSWDEVDKTNTAYIYQDDKDIEAQSADERKAVPIVVPMAYVVKETLLSHLVNAFLGGDKTLRLWGRGPEDVVGCVLLENNLAYQMERMKMALPLYIAMSDAVSYGIGAVSPIWCEEWGMRRAWTGYDDAMGLGDIRMDFEEEELLYEGNKLQTVNPRCLLPDPNVPVQESQDGQMFAWVDRTNFTNMLKTEEYNPDNIFNVRYAKELVGAQSKFYSNRDPGRERYGTGEMQNINPLSPVDIIWAYLDIVPSEMKVDGARLGKREYPEKWLFGVLGDEILIACQPLGLHHNHFPAAIAAPTLSGYSIAPVSIVEMNAGLQHTLNAYFNSRLLNMAAVLNDKIVADPTAVNFEDLKANTPGGLVRLKRRAFGTKIDDILKQLNVVDITSQNIPDSQFIVNFMERVGGAPAAMQGVMRSGPERVTATEHRDVFSSALSRASTIARLFSLMLLHEVGYQMASNTVQLLSKESFVQVKGESDQALLAEYGISGADRERYQIRPFDLDVRYDVSVHDASTLGAEHVDSYIRLLQVIGSSEQMMASMHGRLDYFRLVMHVARLMGVKDFSQFTVKAMDNEQVIREREKGNIVPLAGGEV